MSRTVSAPAFPKRLAALRDLTLADRIGVHMIHGASQPTLDVVRKMTTALQIRAGMLLFGQDERRPEGMIPKHEASRWSGNGGGERK